MSDSCDPANRHHGSRELLTCRLSSEDTSLWSYTGREGGREGVKEGGREGGSEGGREGVTGWAAVLVSPLMPPT